MLDEPTCGLHAEDVDRLIGTLEDLVEAGVIDPTKVVRTALENAASVAALLLTLPLQAASLDANEQRMVEWIDAHSEDAIALLDRLPQHPLRDAFEALAQFAIDRRL